MENTPTDPNEQLSLPISKAMEELCELSDDQVDEIYELTADTGRVKRMLAAKGRRNLDAELAMCRVLLEIRWNSQDHEANAGRGVSNLITDVKDMAVANANLEVKRGTLLDKSQVTGLAQGILLAVTEAALKHIPEKKRKQFFSEIAEEITTLTKKVLE